MKINDDYFISAFQQWEVVLLLFDEAKIIWAKFWDCFYTIPQNFPIQIFSWSRETKPEKDRDFDKNSEIIQNIVLLAIFVINFMNNEFPFFWFAHKYSFIFAGICEKNVICSPENSKTCLCKKNHVIFHEKTIAPQKCFIFFCINADHHQEPTPYAACQQQWSRRFPTTMHLKKISGQKK